MRNLLILMALAAILIVLTQLSGIAAEWRYIVPSEPGAVLYAAAFDDDVSDWALYEGRLSAQAADSALRLVVDAPESLPYSTNDLYFADFDLRVRARATAGPLDNGYGVIFRAQDADNYYLFLISSDGYYQVQRAVEGVERELSTWIASPLVNQGLNVANAVRVIGQGDTFRFYINDEPVALCIPDDPAGISTYVNECIDGQMRSELIDDSIPNGQIGVIARTFGEPGVIVEYDDVLVFGPEVSSE